jgi:O-antigen/teichoic acid export membrane protein
VSIRKHTLYNLVGSILPLGLSLVTIPIYLHLIGESRYGVLAMAWLLLGYFGLFDLGLGRATAQRIAAQADDTPAARAQTFWTALAMNSGLGIVGGLMIWPAALYFFGHVFSIEQVLKPELNAAIPWMILAVPLATISGVLSGALQGRAKFLELNIISVSSAVLTQLFPLFVAWQYGPDLALLMPAVILARLVTMTSMFLRCRRHIFAGQPGGISSALAKNLLRFGGWVTIAALIGPLMVVLDRFVIGAFLGAKPVTYYTVPFQLSDRTTIVSTALSSALFPRLALNDQGNVHKLANLAMLSLAVITTPPIVLGLFLMRPFLHYWLGTNFSQNASAAGEMVLLGFWINSFARISTAQLQATNRPQIIAMCYMIQIVPYLALLLFSIRIFGLEGAAVVFTLRAAVDTFILLYYAGNLSYGAKLLRFPAAIMAISFIAVTLLHTLPLYELVVALIAGASISIWAWGSAPENIRQLVSTKFRRLVA